MLPEYSRVIILWTWCFYHILFSHHTKLGEGDREPDIERGRISNRNRNIAIVIHLFYTSFNFSHNHFPLSLVLSTSFSVMVQLSALSRTGSLRNGSRTGTHTGGLTEKARDMQNGINCSESHVFLMFPATSETLKLPVVKIKRLKIFIIRNKLTDARLKNTKC